ncbi:hypothetical protein SRHO_G00230520 [Serrasalmus rhombeus]
MWTRETVAAVRHTPPSEHLIRACLRDKVPPLEASDAALFTFNNVEYGVKGNGHLWKKVNISSSYLHLQHSLAPPLTNISVLDVPPALWQRQTPLSSAQAPSIFRLSLEAHQQLNLGAHLNNALALRWLLRGSDRWEEGFGVTEARKQPRGRDRQSIAFFFGVGTEGPRCKDELLGFRNAGHIDCGAGLMKVRTIYGSCQ